MIDPTNITNFELTPLELEETLIWWILAAGKDGIMEARCTEAIMTDLHPNSQRRPFETLRAFDHPRLTALLAKHKTGAQSLKAKTILQVVNSELNLQTCTREQMLGIWGMGMKTASCFILHSRPDQQMAGIDTHYLKFLRDNGVTTKKNRPAKPKDNRMHPEYLRMETEGVKLAGKLGLSCARLDLLVWNTYRTGGKLVV